MGRYKKGINTVEKLFNKYKTELNRLKARGYQISESSKISLKEFTDYYIDSRGTLDKYDIKSLAAGSVVFDDMEARKIVHLLVDNGDTELFAHFFDIKYNKDGSINIPFIVSQIKQLSSSQAQDLVSELIDFGIVNGREDFEYLVY